METGIMWVVYREGGFQKLRASWVPIKRIETRRSTLGCPYKWKLHFTYGLGIFPMFAGCREMSAAGGFRV